MITVACKDHVVYHSKLYRYVCMQHAGVYIDIDPAFLSERGAKEQTDNNDTNSILKKG